MLSICYNIVMTHPASRTPCGDLFTQVILETFQLNGLLLAAGDRLTKELDLSSSLWQVLGAIDGGPLHMAQIARNMGLSRQSVRRTSYILEEKDLVFFIENPDHKRAKLVSLTGKGREVLNQLTAIQIDWSNNLAKDLRAHDLGNAVKTLKNIGEKLLSSVEGE